jgi:hypothetical protein
VSENRIYDGNIYEIFPLGCCHKRNSSTRFTMKKKGEIIFFPSQFLFSYFFFLVERVIRHSMCFRLNRWQEMPLRVRAYFCVHQTESVINMHG